MSKGEILRSYVDQRLTAAAEEIFGLFERTIAEYEEELCRSKEENERQQKLLDAVFNPQLQLHRADVQQLLVVKDEVPPEQQDRGSHPDPPHIKEEHEALQCSQEGEQLQGLEEIDITKFTFSPDPVKSEDYNDGNPQSSQLHQIQIEQTETEADGEDIGGSEPASDSDPDSPLQPATHDKTSPPSESETDDSRDWEETEELQSDLNPLQNNEAPASDMENNIRITSVGSSKCTRRLRHNPQKQTRIQIGGKQFSCSVCGETFTKSSSLTAHKRIHTGEKPFNCSVCEKTFKSRGEVVIHMRTHTGEKPFSCSVCRKTFAQQSNLRKHLTVHTGEKPFSCSVCNKSFAQRCNLRTHLSVHTKERPFSCSVCSKTFTQRSNLRTHLTVHTKEKPFSCSVCSKRFTQGSNLRTHLAVHTKEKPYSCSVCSKGFTQRSNLRKHLTVHTKEKPFGCSVCSKRFTHQRTLRAHLTLHKGEITFKCSICDNRFSHLYLLQKHKCVRKSRRFTRSCRDAC